MRPNIVVILSDEHAAAAAGSYGHPTVRTPHLDRLAADGVQYENAYCNSPMCVPSRLSLMSGRHVHEVAAWDNGVIPDDATRFWGAHLREAGYESVQAGRTHNNGDHRLLDFDRRITDDVDFGLDRTGRPPERTPQWRRGSNSHVSEAGAGEHDHTRHDVAATDAAVEFLRERAERPTDSPFLLYVGYMHPHFPLIAPPEYLRMYDPDDVALPPTRNEPTERQHAVIAQLRHAFHNDEPPSDAHQRYATACYWALISHLDHQVGRLMEAVDKSRLGDDTVIIYSSDHGEMGGHHGIWQKQCFYEPSVRVPLLVRPPRRTGSAAAGTRVGVDVSLLDILPTLRDLAGLSADDALAGTSLLSSEILDADDGATRPVLSQYHAQGMVDGGFMLKRGRYKYCAYVGHPPQLFDVVDDPLEIDDLAGRESHAAVQAELGAELRRLLDPDAVDRQAKTDQRHRALAASAVSSPH